jgi:hypothetical protein
MIQRSISVSQEGDEKLPFRSLSDAELDAVSGAGDPILEAKQAAGRVKFEMKLAIECGAGDWFSCNLLDDLLTNGW